MKTLFSFGNICMVALVAFAKAASAGFQPSFDLDRAAFLATDIVVVTEGDKVDGNLLVQEVWKGGFMKGQPLSITDLADFADPETRTVRPWWPLPSDEKPPVILSGKTLILYMIRKENGTSKADESFHWIPWRFVPEKGELRVSVVWLEGEKAYAFKQYARPGDSRLSLINFSKSELKARSIKGVQNTGAPRHSARFCSAVALHRFYTMFNTSFSAESPARIRDDK